MGITNFFKLLTEDLDDTEKKRILCTKGIGRSAVLIEDVMTRFHRLCGRPVTGIELAQMVLSPYSKVHEAHPENYCFVLLSDRPSAVPREKLETQSKRRRVERKVYPPDAELCDGGIRMPGEDTPGLVEATVLMSSSSGRIRLLTYVHNTLCEWSKEGMIPFRFILSFDGFSPVLCQPRKKPETLSVRDYLPPDSIGEGDLLISHWLAGVRRHEWFSKVFGDKVATQACGILTTDSDNLLYGLYQAACDYAKDTGDLYWHRGVGVKKEDTVNLTALYSTLKNRGMDLARITSLAMLSGNDYIQKKWLCYYVGPSTVTRLVKEIPSWANDYMLLCDPAEVWIANLYEWIKEFQRRALSERWTKVMKGPPRPGTTAEHMLRVMLKEGKKTVLVPLEVYGKYLPGVVPDGVAMSTQRPASGPQSVLASRTAEERQKRQHDEPESMSDIRCAETLRTRICWYMNYVLTQGTGLPFATLGTV